MVLLTQEGGILGPFAWVFGQILNLIYEFFSIFGIHNLALCIIFFTIVAKMLMLPLTIKQQRSMKVSSKMNPEIQKIQAKYKGKKDTASQQKQQQEMQAVYEKYGSSPLSGCLPLLISLPIMFALYRVIYKMPAYVGDVKDLYNTVAVSINGIEGIYDAIKAFISNQGVTVSAPEFVLTLEDNVPKLIDVLSGFTPQHWTAFTSGAAIDGLTAWNTVATQIAASTGTPSVMTAIDSIHETNNLMFGLSIVNMSGWSMPGILIPILAAGFQFLQTKLSQVGQKNPTQQSENPAAQSSKAMMTVMPVISFFFCTMMPLGVGLYWILSSVVQIVQQWFINRYFDKLGVDEIIEQNAAKMSKKKSKYGIGSDTKTANFAKTQTKSIVTSKTEPKEETVEAYEKRTRSQATTMGVSEDSKEKAKSGSIADIAHMFDKKNE